MTNETDNREQEEERTAAESENAGAGQHAEPQPAALTEDKGRDGDSGKDAPKRPRRMGLRYFAAGMLMGATVMALAGSLLFAAWQLGWLGGVSVRNQTADAGESAINSDSVYKLQLLENSINQYYYHSDEVTQEQKEDGMYKGLLESLGDPYSVYYTADDVEEMNQESYYYGIGAYVGTDEQTQMAVITGVIPDTPAEAAGLRAGDIIYQVDGESAVGLSTDEVVALVKGEEGTTVRLTIYREGEEEYLEIDVVRAKVDVQTVYGQMLEGEIGYLQITEFDAATGKQFTDALTELKEQDMKGLILDLRSNPGGDVSAVTEVANHILPEGLVFYAEYKDGTRSDYTCDGEDALEVPIVVLVNEYSASASEILTGAIQDAGVGTIVGVQTYGKGIMQNIYSLTDGTAIKLTVANYYTRGGRDINGTGIAPDVECELDIERYYEEGTDSQLEKALEIMEQTLHG
ncbi:MAG: S41 family peptidase [Eubacteriales bacterium]|nr:S41 family peptidase [Eubacteriales bacterium]